AFAIVHASATPVWPPTGIALAAMLLLGRGIWPVIFAGAFLVNVTTAGSVLSSLGIAAGNTLEALVGAALVTRFAGGAAVFGRARPAGRGPAAHGREHPHRARRLRRSGAGPGALSADISLSAAARLVRVPVRSARHGRAPLRARGHRRGGHQPRPGATGGGLP